MVYVFYPTEIEAAPLRRLGAHAEVIVSGIGQVNTARALSALYESGYDGPVVLGGCAGAYVGSGLRVGSVAVATEEIFADLGTDTPDGWLDLSAMGLTLMDAGDASYTERLPMPSGAKALACLSGYDAAGGTFLTVCAVSGTKARGDRLHARYGALCENMEGAAAAQVAAHYGRTLVEVRGVSNMVTDRDRESWDIPLAAENCAKAVAELVRRTDEWS